MLVLMLSLVYPNEWISQHFPVSIDPEDSNYISILFW